MKDERRRRGEKRGERQSLEDKRGVLLLLVTTELEVLATLEGELCLGLALCALQSQDNLLGGLGLLVEDRLGLTTVTGLLTVVTTLTLSEEGSLLGCDVSMRSECGPVEAVDEPCQPCTG